MCKIKKIFALLVCASMIAVLLPGIGAFAKETPDGLEYMEMDGEVTITGYSGSAKDLTIPAKIDGMPVTCIGESAFEGCNTLVSVAIPEYIEFIGLWAFENCENLTSVTVPDSVRGFGPNPFIGTKMYNDKTTWIDGGFYVGNHLLEVDPDFTGDFTIRPGTVGLSVEAFIGCSGITSLTLSPGIEYFGWSTEAMGSPFWELTGVTDVYYTGSEEEWTNTFGGPIFIGFEPVNMHYNSSAPGGAAGGLAGDTADEVKVIVNGSPISFDVPPTILDGTTMLPVRLALEPLGAEFVWDGETQTVTIAAAGKTVVLTVNSSDAIVDGETKTMLKPAMIIDGRTLIPIRFVAECLGYDVKWDGNTRTVIING